MPEIVLHIGTEKTGTTTLQSVGKQNRAWLAARGVDYPVTEGRAAHTRLAIYAARPGRQLDLRRVERLLETEAYEAFKASFAEDFSRQVRGSASQVIWFSTEHLSSRVRRPGDIAKLAALLRPLASRVRVVIYLRPQPDLFLSSYSTAIKAGRDMDPKPPVTGKEYYYHYDTMLRRWAAAFGREAITVRVFQREALVGGDVISDFLSVLGLAEDAEFVRPAELNKRLDADGLRFLRAFNRLVPPARGEVVDPLRGEIGRLLEDVSAGPKLEMPAAVMRGIADLFAPANAAVARKYLGRKDGVLFKPVTYPDGEGTPALTAAGAREIAARLLAVKQGQVEKLATRLGVSAGGAVDTTALLAADSVDQAVAVAAEGWRVRHRALLAMREQRAAKAPAARLLRSEASA